MIPESEQDLARIVASASGPFRIQGGGTRPVGNPCHGQPLVMAGLSGVREYEPGALTIVVGAGTPMAEVNSLLREHGQFLPFEPMDCCRLLGTDGTSTVGGVVATNSSGPRRVLVGACRDFVIGMKFVDGEGKTIKAGGRVMKNVTGYDVSKLLVGSYGTLGVITEVCFKVLPLPGETAALLVNGLSDRQAVRAMTAALNSPFEVAGAAHLPSGIDGHPVTMIRIEGSGVSVDYRVKLLKRLLSSFGDVIVERDSERTQAGWKYVRDVEKFGTDSGGDVWRISTPSGDAVELVERARECGPVEVVYDCGGAVLWIKSGSSLNLRSRLEPLRGHATLVRASDEAKRRFGVFHPQAARVEQLSNALRRQFDPRQLFNRGIAQHGNGVAGRE
ncbi:MAG: FAD-binding protein [Rhodobacteraceae bacterium]|nr:FAD-binding protein [Paracoccaceae bacterium]